MGRVVLLWFPDGASLEGQDQPRAQRCSEEHRSASLALPECTGSSLVYHGPGEQGPFSAESTLSCML